MAADGPLSPAELAELESTLLPALERHHLRLLAHGLRTLQAIAAADGAQHGSDELPDRSAIRSWAADQPPIAQDRAFIEVLSSQLEQLAAELGRPPLSLELRDLIAWTRNQANQRIAIISAVNLPP
jgi:hypothetical protein